MSVQLNRINTLSCILSLRSLMKCTQNQSQTSTSHRNSTTKSDNPLAGLRIPNCYRSSMLPNERPVLTQSSLDIQPICIHNSLRTVLSNQPQSLLKLCNFYFIDRLSIVLNWTVFFLFDILWVWELICPLLCFWELIDWCSQW